nr:cation channel sperm-associated protein subunit beta isoform X2 [Odocoileus virginianus texanus]XP_020731647.1 cation channel sperm-associated protein subunit beta isoform X2 [Odocoileus virginianus texanus]XP_020731648.1 cation channel sperm-associated protein subunit beta isoform X2 [Odocoileus virginianus texanus]XP_020731649.1 cation channel sperm-associated protein subunit beta isoform X2 [Odocoileus virginianus texanus]
MESPHLYVLILLLNMFDFSSGITYNKGDTESHFACDSKGIPQKDEMIKLYLSSDDLKIECFFQSEVEFTTKEFLSVFTSAGLAPSLEIINSTYTGIFHFNLTLYSDRVYWLIDIPRENITKNTDIATVEEWLVRITLQYGLNIYTTEGTLLDTVREPILHWKLGTMMNKRTIQRLYPHVVDLKMTKCPCANDVALLGFVMNTTFDGVYIGLSFSGFWDYDDTQWYNLTDMIYSQVGEEHKQLSVVDMVLTNHFLVILTSLGLFISGDLRYPSSSVLMLSRVDFCGFERVDYIKGKLWYNERCFANREHFEVDYVTITFDRNRTLSEANSCFYSKEPFLEWLPCLPPVPKGTKTILSTVITVLVDQEQSSAVYLFHNQKNTIVSVRILKHNKPDLIQKFPFFSFPSSFSSPVGMIFHPRSHFLYAYGNQVWLSIDGGNTFDLIADFHDDIIKNTYHSFYTSDITLVSQSGKVYLTKAGLEKYSNIGSISDKIFTLYYDHMGFIHKLTPDHFEAGGSLTAFGNSKGIFGQAFDMGFDTALAPQYLTLNEMIFYAYVPKNEPKDRVYTKRFYDIHFGKLIHSRKTGTAYITKVFQHNTPEGFLSSVIAELIDPFGTEEINESSCLSSSLSISEAGNYSYKLSLQLQTPGVISSFQDSDIEKTVVIPGYSSFLITTILDNENALAVATMPEIVPHNMTFQKDSWFLYNFGKRNGQTWNIYAKPCNYWFQQHDDSLSLSVLKYIDLGKSHTLKMKVIPNTKVLRLLEIPLLQVIVGNPNLLEVEVEGYFDESDSYIMEVSTASKTLHQGSTSLEFIVWGASTECYVTTFVPMLKSSCSYLKSMHHIPSEIIPLEDWMSGVYMNSQGFNMIKVLPINYRPPSNMGIAIPLTDNFYHADPSKPIPRNLFYKSKRSGKFKQCANATTRKECNCTNDQKFSYAVAFSDCREKVPRFKFPVIQYPISLQVFSEDGNFPVETPYLVTVTEVNNRENWNLRHTVPENVKKMKNYLESILSAPVYNPLGLNLSIKGSELFHFRVSVVPGVSFCNLVEEFQIYVDEAPLPFPGHTLIAVAAAVLLGGLIFIAFMFQIRNIHPWDTFKKLIRRSNVNPTNTTAN